ncbi:unnamed protein product [Acanthoscelides obtectus]|uniref:Uncharacterized protein n=1 Tax=Acanthoscelides obtectus TaxID=200917 RepID=A0A9P0L0U6_ACAOB|nr:unnamed protein product [Acanthoscelides obtectus]CAK1677977.1 hypothetical protein AOBTE_LOCUS31691 [Acanthoscelides obtectus]
MPIITVIIREQIDDRIRLLSPLMLAANAAYTATILADVLVIFADRVHELQMFLLLFQLGNSLFAGLQPLLSRCQTIWFDLLQIFGNYLILKKQIKNPRLSELSKK